MHMAEIIPVHEQRMHGGVMTQALRTVLLNGATVATKPRAGRNEGGFAVPAAAHKKSPAALPGRWRGMR
jgi:hypothetical protein